MADQENTSVMSLQQTTAVKAGNVRSWMAIRVDAIQNGTMHPFWEFLTLMYEKED